MYILWLSLFYTASNNADYEKISISLDTPWKKLVIVAFLLLLTVCLVGIRGRNEAVVMNVLLVIMLLYVAGVSICFIRFLDMPLIGDDSGICYSVAWQLFDGDYTQFAPGGYLTNYPQQIGTVMVNLLIFRFFGQGAYKPFYYFNTVLLIATVFAGDMLVRDLEKRKGTRVGEILWLFFSAINLPAFLYVHYMYGEVASYSGMIIVSWMLYEYVKTDHIRWIFGALPFVAISMLLRKNTIIFIVATIIVLLISAIWKKNWKPVLFALCIFLAAQVPGYGIRAYYARISNMEVTGGIPFELWIAMGMQDEWNGPGWYNDYNRVVFAEQGSDIAASKKVARDYIKSRTQEFRANPQMAKDFYKRKLISQWAEPSYDSMFLCVKTQSGDEKVQSFVSKLTAGEYTEWFWKYCNIYQAVVYAGFFLYILMQLSTCLKNLFSGKHSNLSLQFLIEDIGQYILLVSVIGGFLFSILWEAKSRYIVEYLVMMLPMAALGYAMTAGVIKRMISGLFHK